MKIKGNSLAVVPEVIQKNFGEVGLGKWLDALTPEARQAYEMEINPTDWYDLDKYYLDPVQIYCDMFWDGDYRGAYQMGEADAINTLRGVYKLFIQMGSPEYLIKKASILFPTYYKEAKMEIVELEKGKSTLRISEFGNSQMRQVNHYTIQGWMHQAMKICGVDKLDVSVQDSEGGVEFVIEWE